MKRVIARVRHLRHGAAGAELTCPRPMPMMHRAFHAFGDVYRHRPLRHPSHMAHMSDRTAASVSAIQLDWSGLSPLARTAATLASSFVEWALAFRELNDTRARTAAIDPAVPFAERALRALRVTIDVDESSLCRI